MRLLLWLLRRLEMIRAGQGWGGREAAAATVLEKLACVGCVQEGCVCGVCVCA